MSLHSIILWCHEKRKKCLDSGVLCFIDVLIFIEGGGGWDVKGGEETWLFLFCLEVSVLVINKVFLYFIKASKIISIIQNRRRKNSHLQGDPTRALKRHFFLLILPLSSSAWSQTSWSKIPKYWLILGVLVGLSYFFLLLLITST